MSQLTVTSSAWGGQTDPNNPNATAPYYIFGDHDSVATLGDLLVSNCSATIGTEEALVQNGTDYIAPEEVVQWYRDSSFGLALSSYNDPANSEANAPASNDSSLTTVPDAPIPPGTNLTFLNCINETIGYNVPIMDANSALLNRASVPLMSQLALMWVVLAIVGLV